MYYILTVGLPVFSGRRKNSSMATQDIQMYKQEGLCLGAVRAPLPGIIESDMPIINACASKIDDAIGQFV